MSETNSDVLSGDVIDYNMYLVRIKPKSKKRIPMTIKFVINYNRTWGEHDEKFDYLNDETNIEAIDNLKYAGLPLADWLTKNDTICSILDKYPVKYKGQSYMHDVTDCYRVRENEKFIEIPNSKWKQYSPFWQFLWKYPDDYLIFVLSRSSGTRFDNVDHTKTIDMQ